jgi:thiol-disulfide isomerase/thioredoxin
MQLAKLTRFTVLTLALAAFTAHAALKVGDAFPDLATFGLEGKLPDTKGKIVVVDFWASWCGPCKESFPVMNELQKKYGDKVIIIAVNVDENAKDKDAFLKDNAASFVVVRDAKQKLVDKVEIGKMPSSFVLDADGKVKFVHDGFDGAATKKSYEQQLDSLVSK